ncbi:MAG: restriction endonuclease subunit S [Thermodesulfobacteriota bacterium]|nr:restriction endonuclease subunit S [Thermodesulfobacteriota bacterium]
MGRKQGLLGEIVKFGNGKSRPNTEGIHPIYGGNGMLGYTSDTNYEGEIIIIGRVGAYCGATYYENRPVWVSDNALAATPKDNNNAKYIYYFLKNMDLNQHAEGSSHPLVTQTLLNSIDIEFSDEESEQKTIASVLSSLDDKIDLLHRQNKTLKAMAETLFRQWFVEEAQEGWEEKRLGDILTTIESGSRPKGGIDPDLKHGIPSIGAENINGLGNYNYGSTKYITSEYFEKMKRGIVQDYDVLIYKDGAYIGKKSMFAKGFPFKKSAINEHVFILRTKSIFLQIFLYFALEQEELALLNANSAQPGLNQTSMKSFELLLPKSELIGMFGQTIMPLIDKIFSNGNQIRTLEKLRDTLLPKLMSGEVRVEI